MNQMYIDSFCFLCWPRLNPSHCIWSPITNAEYFSNQNYYSTTAKDEVTGKGKREVTKGEEGGTKLNTHVRNENSTDNISKWKSKYQISTDDYKEVSLGKEKIRKIIASYWIYHI